MTTSERVYWASRKTRKTRISLFRIFPPSAHFLLATRRTRYFHVEFSCFEIAEIMLVESSYSHEVLMLPCNENHKVSHRRIFSFIIIPFSTFPSLLLLHRVSILAIWKFTHGANETRKKLHFVIPQWALLGGREGREKEKIIYFTHGAFVHRLRAYSERATTTQRRRRRKNINK